VAVTRAAIINYEIGREYSASEITVMLHEKTIHTGDLK